MLIAGWIPRFIPPGPLAEDKARLKTLAELLAAIEADDAFLSKWEDSEEGVASGWHSVGRTPMPGDRWIVVYGRYLVSGDGTVVMCRRKADGWIYDNEPQSPWQATHWMETPK